MSAAASFCSSPLAKFVNSSTGRALRLIVGLAIIGYGYTQRGTSTGTILMIVGLVPLAAGVFNLCLVSAILGGGLRCDKV